MGKLSGHEPDNSNEIQLLRYENERLIKVVEEKSALLKLLEDKLLKQTKSFTILNSYSFELASQSNEEIYKFISENFKSIFSVKEVWISIYDENSGDLILKGTTLSENDNSRVVKMLGRNILGFRTPVSPETYRMMLNIGVGEPSSLHEISFGSIPLLISSALEKIFGIGWFQGVSLKDKGELFGGLVVAGYKGQLPLVKEELKIFTEITSNILRRKQIEKELQLSETKFREFSDLLPQLIFEADLKGNLTFINHFGLNLLGYSKENFQTGVNVFSLIEPQNAESAVEAFKKTVNGSNPVPREFMIIGKNDRIVPILLHAALYTENNEPKGIRGTGVDITELKDAREMLSLERNLLRSLIDNIPDRIYAKDTSSRFIICNDALVKRMGKENASEVIGKSDLELLEIEKAKDYVADEQAIMRTGIPLVNKEETVVFKSGEVRYSLSTKVPLRNANGEIVGIVGIGRDITARKRAEMEVETKNELLQKIIAEKDKFFSIIAHDLKSPFNYFLGFTELISDEIDSMSPQKIREITSNMRKSAINLYSLLENLLEWSKMQRGVLEFSPEKIVLAERIINCVDIISGPAAKKEITINYRIPDDIEVIADKHMLDAIIRNLVSNSIKFTKRRGVITISGSESDEGIVKISVYDTGIGMDAKMVKNLFKPDVDTRRKGTDDEPSTGLGLLLCKEFVEKHGGEIWIDSEEGLGSTFTFSIDNNKLLKTNIVVE